MSAPNYAKSRVAFSTKFGFELLRVFIERKDIYSLEIITDIVASTYVSAFCLMFPRSIVEYNTLDSVTMVTATLLVRSNVDRLTFHLAERLYGRHTNYLPTTMYEDIESAVSHMTDWACECVKDFFDPDNGDIFTIGSDRNYRFEISDTASGHLIMVQVNDLSTSTCTDQSSNAFYNKRERNY